MRALVVLEAHVPCVRKATANFLLAKRVGEVLANLSITVLTELAPKPASNTLKERRKTESDVL